MRPLTPGAAQGRQLVADAGESRACDAQDQVVQGGPDRKLDDDEDQIAENGADDKTDTRS